MFATNLLIPAQAMRALKKYGRALVSNLPEQATALLFKLCATTNADSSTNPIQEFIHLYMNERRWLRHFLERVVELHASLVTSMVWMTLLELYMVEAKSGDTTSTDEDASADRAMHLLRNPNAAYDPEQALVLAQLHDHAPAILYLLEKLRRYQDLLQFHMDRGDHARVLASAHRFGDHDSTLWLHVLSYFTALPTITPELHAVLAHIEEQDLVPPLRVIQILAKNERVPLSAVREFVVGKVRAQMEEMEADRALMETYVRETEQMRAEIAELQATYVVEFVVMCACITQLKTPLAPCHSTKVFQVTKCSSCAAPLELPTVHFLCKHSYHHRCLGENERECPKCAPEHRLVLDIQRSQEVDAKQHDQFFRQVGVTRVGRIACRL